MRARRVLVALPLALAPALQTASAAVHPHLHGEILDVVAGVLDVGVLPGTPSTVVDVTGPEPRVLREGAVPAAEALAQLRE